MTQDVRKQRRPKAKDLKKEFNPPQSGTQRKAAPKPDNAGVRLPRL